MYLSNSKFLKVAALTVMCGLSVSAYAHESKAGGFDANQDKATPAGEIVFNKINPAISMGSAYGDMSKGAHGTFGKFPANFTTPNHTHTGAYHGVVIKGVMTNPFKGDANPPELVAGSYWYVPAGSPHATACISDTPCMFYFHADSAFDFHPVGE